MIFIYFNLFINFQYFFPNEIINLTFKDCKTSIILSNFGNFLIYYCNFFQFNNRPIFISTNSNSNTLISNCIFNKCIYSSNYGGAIYIYCINNGKVILNCIYGSECFSNEGHFSYITSNINNSYFFVSISKCSKDINSKLDSISILNGYQKINYFNSSFNNAIDDSGIHLIQSNICFTSFSNFNLNNASRAMIIRFDSGIINLNFCNIINNFQKETIWGIIHHHSGTSILFNCIILNNNAYLSNPKLFFQNVGNCKIDSCWIQNYGTNYQATIQNQLGITLPYIFNYINCSFEITLKIYYQKKRIQFYFCFIL